MHKVCVEMLISDLIVGKPKCFFVQACRGNVPQGTVDIPDSKKEVMLDQVVGKISIPTDADLLLTYSTTQGTSILQNIDFSLQYISFLSKLGDLIMPFSFQVMVTPRTSGWFNI